MVLLSRQLGLVLTLLLLFPLQACEKKEPRAPETTTEAAEQTRPYVTTRDLKVRSGPGTRYYKVVAEIKSGTRVNVAGHEEGWLKIVSKQGNPPGYIDQRFAKPAGEPPARAATPLQGSYTTTADTSVREGPGLHYKAVARIEGDTKVNVVGAVGDWLKVQSKHGNPPGYIEKRYAERRPN